MDYVTSFVAGEVSDLFKEAVKRGISYAFFHEEKLEDFMKIVGTLKEKRDRVKSEVDAAERNGEKIHTDVKSWLIKADDMINAKLKEVEGLEDEAMITCFIGMCPNFMARYRLGQKAEEEAKAANEILQQGESLDKVSHPDVPPSMAFAPSENIEAFDSRKQVFDEIVTAVKNPSINIIGVYGLPGVGKTALVKEVVRQAKEVKLFDEAVMAIVTHSPDIHEIQSQIAEMLGLKLEEESKTGRASRLCERLKKKKILVVLDDIWVRLDLTEVGIPFGEEHHGCTILLTSRDVNVLSKDMDATHTFPIQVLTEEEALSLFKKIAGDIVESPDLWPVATEVAKKCGGLPVAINALARSLRNEPPFVWEDALQRLNKPLASNFRGLPPEVYTAIEVSYNHLESEEHKQTFLLCSLMCHNAYIQDLLKYAMGLRLYHGVSSVKETRNRLLTVVSHLKASFLLLDGHSKGQFDMHDVICDVAISIASKDNRVFYKRQDDVLNDWPEGHTMNSWDKMSLWYATISYLPDRLECPNLTFLCMGDKDDFSMKISNNFFEEMKILKVLDLTKMYFPALPSSISQLANLQALCLDQCVLRDIALIGELKNLEILSFLHSDIETLPKEIGQLVKLKLLDLSHSKLKKIPFGVFSKLCRLEELYMGNSFVQWEVEGHPSEKSNASLVELAALSCLTVLDVHIPNAHIIPKDFPFEKLQRYNIFIGEAWDWDLATGSSEYSRTLKLKLQTSIGFLNKGIKVVLKNAENLYLDEMNGVEILLPESEAGDFFLHLKNLHIQNGGMIQYILKDNDVLPKIDVLQLKSLTLKGLPKLLSFCSGNKGSTSISPQRISLFNQKMVFPKLEKLKLSSIGIQSIWLSQGFCSTQNLTTLIIEGCANLERIISYSTVQFLQQLECLEIIECKCIQEIISAEEIELTALISFPRLNSLKLKDLQKLIGFCREDYAVEFPALKNLEIHNCPELKGFIYQTISLTDGVLFNEKVAFPNLEINHFSGLRKVKRMWSTQLHADSFSNLKELKVGYCDALLSIFPPFLIAVFQRLERLTIQDCASLEQVFQLPDIEETNEDPNHIISFQNLRTITVERCGSLKTLFPFPILRDLQQVLESLTIQGCGGLEGIVSKNTKGSDEHNEILLEFNQLSLLQLWFLPNLIYFYPGMHTTRWPALKMLHIQQPLSLSQKIISQLEEITFCCDDLGMILNLNGQFAEDSFCCIKFIRITTYRSESAVFPFSILQRFYNLERLELFDCKFKELSPYEGDVGTEEKHMNNTLPKIKKLTVDWVYYIRHLWEQDSPMDHICSSLESLQVWRCDSLISLSPAFLSFQNLRNLDVWRCKEIAILITSSTARTLQRLVSLTIGECEMMRQVIASEGDEATANHEIVFSGLKYLELCSLQSLKCFCSGDYTFKFPSLDQVLVTQCPTLKSFCHGTVSTPKLQKVQLTDHRARWAGDLNATVEQLNLQANEAKGEASTSKNKGKAIVEE